MSSGRQRRARPAVPTVTVDPLPIFVRWVTLSRIDRFGHAFHDAADRDSGWRVDQDSFEEGCAIEAAFIGRVIAWANLHRVTPMPTRPYELHALLLRASKGLASIDDIYVAQELDDYIAQVRSNPEGDVFPAVLLLALGVLRALRAPRDWWKSLIPTVSMDDPERRLAEMRAQAALHLTVHNPSFLLPYVIPSGLHAAIEDAMATMTEIKRSMAERYVRLDQILAPDERELIELFARAYPNVDLTADERDSRDGGGVTGEPEMTFILSHVPHSS
ncbi:hypothetical protein PENSPDRAFT_694585 [Peniophora sp. CONT]|nr:hypothetical protein PENSPDRAFT_694585 [Peniophora sp. CONT]